MKNIGEMHNIELSNNTQDCVGLNENDVKALGYLTLLNIANNYCRSDPRKINQRIGQISADLIESEFAEMDKRNLKARRDFLIGELKNIAQLRLLDEYEAHFINHGREYVSKMGICAISLLNSYGVPHCTLEAAGFHLDSLPSS